MYVVLKLLPQPPQFREDRFVPSYLVSLPFFWLLTYYKGVTDDDDAF